MFVRRSAANIVRRLQEGGDVSQADKSIFVLVGADSSDPFSSMFTFVMARKIKNMLEDGESVSVVEDWLSENILRTEGDYDDLAYESRQNSVKEVRKGFRVLRGDKDEQQGGVRGADDGDVGGLDFAKAKDQTKTISNGGIELSADDALAFLKDPDFAGIMLRVEKVSLQ